jgi:hypothetical protein
MKEYLFQFDEGLAYDRHAQNHTEVITELAEEYKLLNKPFPTDDYKQHQLLRDRIQELVEAERDKFEADSARYAGMSSVYELADRVLTNQDLTVVMRPLTEKAVAWTDGKQIVFNTSAISNGDYKSDEFITTLHGINFHEVAHALFTPRQNSKLIKWVTENRYRTAFNYLEDNRIENMLVVKYPSIKNFVVLNLIKHTIDTAQDMPENIYPVIAGRNFLPTELYQDVLTDFVTAYGSDLAKTVMSITTEFASLVLSKQEARAMELIKQFAELFNLQDPEPQGQEPQQGAGGEGQKQDQEPQQGAGQSNNSIPNTTCSGRSPMGSGRPQAGSEQEKVQSKSQPSQQGGYDFDSTKSDSGESDTENNDGNIKPDSGKGSDSSSDTDNKTATEQPSKYDSIINDLINSEAVRQQVKDTKSAIQKAEGKINILPKAPTKVEKVTPEMLRACRKFADELIRSEIDSDPAWNKQQPSGRLNIQRAMNMDINDMNTVFDRWTFGDQSIDIESAVLIDNSGSMAGSEIYYANQYAWVIKRAIEQVQGKCSTLTFSTFSKRLYDSNEKASATEYRWIGSNNDTNAYPALTQANINMNNSQATIKTVFILTDGSWSYAKDSDRLIAEMRQAGVVVTVVFLNGYAKYQIEKGGKTLSDYQQEYGHGADVFSVIGEAHQLSQVAKDVLVSAVKKMEAH